MRPRRGAAAAAALSACVGLLRASSAPASPDATTGTRPDEHAFFGPAEFLEKSYIFYSMPAPMPNPTGTAADGSAVPAKTWWLILEAQPALHFYFWNRLGHLLRNPEIDTWRWTVAPSFTFQTQIRFLTSESTPVRTPSFMPRLNLQLFAVNFPEHASLGGTPVLFRELELIFQIGHHSDGQEFCEYQLGRIDGACTQTGPRSPGDYSNANLVNGSFGTDYLALGAHMKVVTAVDGNYYARTSFSFGGIVQYNTSGWLPGDLSAADKQIYGQWRPRVDFEFQRLTNLTPWGCRSSSLLGHFRVAASYMHIFGTGPEISWYRASAEVSRTFLQLGGAGLFARFFSGQDYYNINFVHRIDWQAQAGLIIDLATPLYFGPGHKSFPVADDLGDKPAPPKAP